MVVVVNCGGSRANFTPDRGDIAELRDFVASEFKLAASDLKIIVNGKLFAATADGHSTLPSNASKALVLVTQHSQIQQLEEAREAGIRDEAKRLAQRRLAAKATPTRTPEAPLEYTFGEVKALKYGDYQRAQAYLERIRDDRAVQALMAKYQLKVGVLTELDPTANTEFGITGSVESRKLGLNENAGMVIRLRIRTDDYDGFRNYHDAKMVLCHELAHNSHGEHNADFWRVCKIYEQEIVALDPYKGHGHTLI